VSRCTGCRRLRWPAAWWLQPIATFWLARKFVHRIGYTGDCLGAVQQVTEVMFYLCAGSLPR
jgi:cobalamin synthase